MHRDYSTGKTRVHFVAPTQVATWLHAGGANRLYSRAARYFGSRRGCQTTRDFGRSRRCRLADFSLMTIEGLGKKFQEARLARNLTLEEAARMTKIRPQRLAEIEGDDFSQFPSLAYAKGFLLIYGKFLDVDVTPYLDACEDSESVTVDGYSYLQENERAKPVSAPVVRRRPTPTGGNNRFSLMTLIVGIVVLVVGFLGMKFLLNVQRLAPGRGGSSAQTSPAAVTSGGSSPAAAP